MEVQSEGLPGDVLRYNVPSAPKKKEGRVLETDGLPKPARKPSAVLTLSHDFTADAAPVPQELVIAAGAGEVQQDSAETELGEINRHRNLRANFILVNSHN